MFADVANPENVPYKLVNTLLVTPEFVNCVVIALLLATTVVNLVVPTVILFVFKNAVLYIALLLLDTAVVLVG